GAATLGSSVYVMGGSTASGDAQTTTHERFMQSDSASIEQGGQVVIEAEHYDDIISRAGKSWVNKTDRGGYAGSGAMVAWPDTGIVIDLLYAVTSPELEYQVL